MLKYIILGTLYCKKMTGYDIRKCIESQIGMFYKASYGSIYPLLNGLLEDGFVTCEDFLDGKRKKKCYEITKKGREAFITWFSEMPCEQGNIELFMAGVFFFDILPEETAQKQIGNYEKMLKLYLAKLLAKRKEFEGLPHPEKFYYKLSTLYFGINKIQGLLQWCSVVKEKRNLEELVELI